MIESFAAAGGTLFDPVVMTVMDFHSLEAEVSVPVPPFGCKSAEANGCRILRRLA
jgi:hypothetical protein